MYKILIIGNDNKELKNIQKYNYKTTSKENAKQIINSEEFDFIYVCDSGKKIMKKFQEYILLPESLSKFSINKDRNNTYVHNDFINKIVSGSLGIISTKDELEEMTLQFILTKIMCSDNENVKLYKIVSEFKELYNRISIHKIIDQIVLRDYSQGSIKRIIRYLENNEKIKIKFFNNLINNIQSDIEEFEGFEIAKVNKIVVY